MNFVRRWWQRRILDREDIEEELWQKIVRIALQHYHLKPSELIKLRQLTVLFLHAKTISGAGDQIVDDYIRTVVAASACLLILQLGMRRYDGWAEVIIYPGSFIVHRSTMDSTGVVHQHNDVLGGEAWLRGPVVLSWEDAAPGAVPHGPGSNVILHEFAHKLDMRTGQADGFPPLHREMNSDSWLQIFQGEFDKLRGRIQRHHPTCIDPYGANSPAEFFAVVSEEFFEMPGRLHDCAPALYTQLKLFYRQDPLARMRTESVRV